MENSQIDSQDVILVVPSSLEDSDLSQPTLGSFQDDNPLGLTVNLFQTAAEEESPPPAQNHSFSCLQLSGRESDPHSEDFCSGKDSYESDFIPPSPPDILHIDLACTPSVGGNIKMSDGTSENNSVQEDMEESERSSPDVIPSSNDAPSQHPDENSVPDTQEDSASQDPPGSQEKTKESVEKDSKNSEETSLEDSQSVYEADTEIYSQLNRKDRAQIEGDKPDENSFATFLQSCAAGTDNSSPFIMSASMEAESERPQILDEIATHKVTDPGKGNERGREDMNPEIKGSDDDEREQEKDQPMETEGGDNATSNHNTDKDDIEVKDDESMDVDEVPTRSVVDGEQTENETQEFSQEDLLNLHLTFSQSQSQLFEESQTILPFAKNQSQDLNPLKSPPATNDRPHSQNPVAPPNPFSRIFQSTSMSQEVEKSQTSTTPSSMPSLSPTPTQKVLTPIIRGSDNLKDPQNTKDSLNPTAPKHFSQNESPVKGGNVSKNPFQDDSSELENKTQNKSTSTPGNQISEDRKSPSSHDSIAASNPFSHNASQSQHEGSSENPFLQSTSEKIKVSAKPDSQNADESHSAPVSTHSAPVTESRLLSANEISISSSMGMLPQNEPTKEAVSTVGDHSTLKEVESETPSPTPTPTPADHIIQSSQDPPSPIRDRDDPEELNPTTVPASQSEPSLKQCKTISSDLSYRDSLPVTEGSHQPKDDIAKSISTPSTAINESKTSNLSSQKNIEQTDNCESKEAELALVDKSNKRDSEMSGVPSSSTSRQIDEDVRKTGIQDSSFDEENSQKMSSGDFAEDAQRIPSFSEEVDMENSTQDQLTENKDSGAPILICNPSQASENTLNSQTSQNAEEESQKAPCSSRNLSQSVDSKDVPPSVEIIASSDHPTPQKASLVQHLPYQGESELMRTDLDVNNNLDPKNESEALMNMQVASSGVAEIKDCSAPVSVCEPTLSSKNNQNPEVPLDRKPQNSSRKSSQDVEIIDSSVPPSSSPSVQHPPSREDSESMRKTNMDVKNNLDPKNDSEETMDSQDTNTELEVAEFSSQESMGVRIELDNAETQPFSSSPGLVIISSAEGSNKITQKESENTHNDEEKEDASLKETCCGIIAHLLDNIVTTVENEVVGTTPKRSVPVVSAQGDKVGEKRGKESNKPTETRTFPKETSIEGVERNKDDNIRNHKKYDYHSQLSHEIQLKSKLLSPPGPTSSSERYAELRGSAKKRKPSIGGKSVPMETDSNNNPAQEDNNHTGEELDKSSDTLPVDENSEQSSSLDTDLGSPNKEGKHDKMYEVTKETKVTVKTIDNGKVVKTVSYWENQRTYTTYHHPISSHSSSGSGYLADTSSISRTSSNSSTQTHLSQSPGYKLGQTTQPELRRSSSGTSSSSTTSGSSDGFLRPRSGIPHAVRAARRISDHSSSSGSQYSEKATSPMRGVSPYKNVPEEGRAASTDMVGSPRVILTPVSLGKLSTEPIASEVGSMWGKSSTEIATPPTASDINPISVSTPMPHPQKDKSDARPHSPEIPFPADEMQSSEGSSFRSDENLSTVKESPKSPARLPINEGIPIMAKVGRENFYYPGVIRRQDPATGKYTVFFEDDERERVIRESDILLIDMLPVGQEVYAQSDSDDPTDWYSAGNVLSYWREGDKRGYVVQKTEQDTQSTYVRRYTRKQVIVKQENLPKDMRLNRVQPVSSPTTSDVSLDNVLDGKRRPRRSAIDRSPAVSRSGTPSPRTARTPRSTRKRSVSENSESSGSSACVPYPSGQKTKRAKLNFGNTSTPSPAKRAKSSKVSAVYVQSDIFKNCGFLLTSTKGRDHPSSEFDSPSSDGPAIVYDREVVRKQILAGGGVIAKNFTQLMSCDRSQLYVISDNFCRTLNYFNALAAGIPCLSYLWISNSSTARELKPTRAYILPAGFSLKHQRVVERPAVPVQPLSGIRVSLQTKNLVTWNSLLSIAGCHTVSTSRQEAKKHECPLSCDVVIADASCSKVLLERAKALNIRVVTLEWVIQCLINSEKLPFDGHAQYTLVTG